MTNKMHISLVLGIMCLALTFGICVQIRTVREYSTQMTQSYAQNNLRAEVLKYKEKYENELNEIKYLDEELDKKIEGASTENQDLEQVKKQIKDANKLIGLTEVTGPGVIITLEDSKIDASTVLDPSLLVVHDLDILAVINELKNAGAEAISVNEQRIVPTSAVQCGGNIITVNGEKIGSPFIIKAIGLPENLANLNRTGGYLECMRDAKVTAELKKSNNITIPKYAGIINYKYVQNVK